MKKSTALLASVFMSLSLTGCASNVSDERLASFSLDAASFGSEWEQVNENAGDANFRGDRVGDLCQLDYLIRDEGGESPAGPMMVIQDGGFGTESWDGTERIVYANYFVFTSSEQVRDALQRIELKIQSCSRGEFLSSTEDGILRSESDTRTFTEINDIGSLLGVSPDSVVAFDYIRLDKGFILNTNNDYSDESEYESRGRVVVISSTKSILLVTSGGQIFKKYEPAPSINTQNVTLTQQLKMIFD